ncbi:hypothetical protein FDP41_003021 [Naegleria fowleri]|uniref:Uncharacterized protein n=1 Tax=Naegleria fowleri TaxID=5763 RepID=A0A6A5BXN5_NAEFO|nr:uncharacterized protein FDP41_003021 [Naegleria fowleri]KAF0977699.1 hypothetical protein FDP41_003021 [Naegleria fowleri]
MKIFQVEAVGDGPGGICYHVMEVIGSKFYVFLGQRHPKANPNSIYIFDMINQIWTCLEHQEGNAPTPRSMAASCVVGKNIYIFGGYSSNTNSENQSMSHVHHHNHASSENNTPSHVVYNGMYYFDTDTYRWIHIENNKNSLWPDPRAGAQMWHYNGKLYLLGGCQGRQLYFSTLYEYTIETNTWKIIETTCGENASCLDDLSSYELVHFNPVVHASNQNESFIQKPKRFCCFSANLIGNELFIFGGLYANEEMEHHQASNTLFVLDMDTMEWRRPHMASDNTLVPGARASHTLCDIGSCDLILTGGCDVVHNSDYDPHVYMLNVKEMKWYCLTDFFFGSHMPKLVGMSSVYCKETKQVFYLGGKGYDDVMNYHFYRIDTTLVKLIHEHEAYLSISNNGKHKNYGSTALAHKRSSLKVEKSSSHWSSKTSENKLVVETCRNDQEMSGYQSEAQNPSTREKRSKSSIITYSPIPKVDSSEGELLEFQNDGVKREEGSSSKRKAKKVKKPHRPNVNHPSLNVSVSSPMGLLDGKKSKKAIKIKRPLPSNSTSSHDSSSSFEEDTTNKMQQQDKLIHIRSKKSSSPKYAIKVSSIKRLGRVAGITHLTSEFVTNIQKSQFIFEEVVQRACQMTNDMNKKTITHGVVSRAFAAVIPFVKEIPKNDTNLEFAKAFNNDEEDEDLDEDYIEEDQDDLEDE